MRPLLPCLPARLTARRLAVALVFAGACDDQAAKEGPYPAFHVLDAEAFAAQFVCAHDAEDSSAETEGESPCLASEPTGTSEVHPDPLMLLEEGTFYVWHRTPGVLADDEVSITLDTVCGRVASTHIPWKLGKDGYVVAQLDAPAGVSCGMRVGASVRGYESDPQFTQPSRMCNTLECSADTDGSSGTTAAGGSESSGTTAEGDTDSGSSSG